MPILKFMNVIVWDHPNIQQITTNSLTEKVYSILKQIENKIIVVANEEVELPEIEFEFDKEFLKEFYKSIKKKLESSNIRITEIKHPDYHEIYKFERGGFVATYKFWYKKNGVFGKVEIIPPTTGLADEINELLKNEVSVWHSLILANQLKH